MDRARADDTAATAVEPGPLQVVPRVRTHLIRSKYVDQTFKVDVMQPVQREGETMRFPVVYATDGNLTFDLFKGISHVLQASGQDVMPYILVGIGYPSESPHAGQALRGRDFTFPGYPRFARKVPSIEGVLAPKRGTRESEGAVEFQQFIGRELIPRIDTKYATVPHERTYFGHSAGGGFGLYTLFTQPDLFRNYIVSSPGLIYHGTSSAGVQYEDYDFALALVRDFIAAGKQLQRCRLYMSVGSEEERDSQFANWRLTSSFHRMVELLNTSAISGLDVQTEVLSGETHASAWPVAFVHGVKSVLGLRVRTAS